MELPYIDKGNITRKSQCYPSGKNIKEADLIIITVKQYHLKEIIPFIKTLTIHTPLCLSKTV